MTKTLKECLEMRTDDNMSMYARKYIEELEEEVANLNVQVEIAYQRD